MEQRNRLIHGDCCEILGTFDNASIDFVLTDPPYLAHYRSRDGRTFAGEDNDDWLRPSFEQIYRVLAPDRFCVSFYGWHRVDAFMEAWRAVGFRPIGHIVWTKRYPSSVKFTQAHHECAYVLAKGDPPHPSEAVRDVLRFPYTGNRLHPTQKPLEALKPLIQAFSKPGDTVLDPFAGSGSTAMAAVEIGRHFIAIEMVWRYYRAAHQRLTDAGASLSTH